MRNQRIHPTRSWIPNTVTGVSVFMGYAAIIAAFEHKYALAAWLIVFAGILDLFDGRLARVMGGESKFGSSFDSLADAINYGVGPSLLYYQLYFTNWSYIGVAFTFLPTVCGAIRLARFSVLSEESDDNSVFVGLPTTMAAGLMASYVIFIHDISGGYGSTILAAALLAIAAVLMISTVSYEHNSTITNRPLRKNWKAALFLIALASVIIFNGRALFIWIGLYVAYGLARSTFHTTRNHRQRKASV